MRPTIVESGQAALAALTHARDLGTPFPLVLLDAMMPAMDGFTLAAHIQHDPTLASATIMMLTSRGQRHAAARCQELGIAAYLTKPITQAELWQAIGRVLNLPHPPLHYLLLPPAAHHRRHSDLYVSCWRKITS